MGRIQAAKDLVRGVKMAVGKKAKGVVKDVKTAKRFNKMGPIATGNWGAKVKIGAGNTHKSMSVAVDKREGTLISSPRLRSRNRRVARVNSVMDSAARGNKYMKTAKKVGVGVAATGTVGVAGSTINKKRKAKKVV